MQLTYGSYTFDAGQAEITTEYETLWTDGGQPYAQRRTFHVLGKMSVSSQADATAKWNSLVNALAIPFKDLTLLQDGGAQSATVLLNAGSSTGVRVVSGPNLVEGRGAVYATYLPYSFTATAEYPLAGTNNLLLRFRETFTYEGGGPLYRHRPCLSGPFQRQLVYPQLPYAVTQEGEAVGYRGYPTPPAPRFPAAMAEPPNVRRLSPEKRGKIYQAYPIQWRVRFESVAPLVGLPTLWPMNQ